MTVPATTSLLDRVDTPADLKGLTDDELRRLADELRQETISAVSVTGGHLGAGLGVVELTVALHYVFNTPQDRLIWDVGHQAYPHKIVTGRRSRIRTLRQEGGLSGFTRRSESEYDPFGAAHSSTSISAGLGMAVARDLAGGNNNVIAVIGDGALSAGMAYEAMNNAGALRSRLIVVLNEKLLEVMGDDVTQEQAFAHANDVLKNAVGGISDIIHIPGLVNVDFEDVKTVMSEPGKAMMGTAVAGGPDRANKAADAAVALPVKAPRLAN